MSVQAPFLRSEDESPWMGKASAKPNSDLEPEVLEGRRRRQGRVQVAIGGRVRQGSRRGCFGASGVALTLVPEALTLFRP